ncbi:MAG TPA: hypothetical protein VFX18_02985 [Candidatus Nitrosocosmicus sp.]|nr:hypothetical protein [Candidatus Nitrosocosmicus sp.]
MWKDYCKHNIVSEFANNNQKREKELESGFNGPRVCESNLTQFQGSICTIVAGNNAFYRNTII